MGLLVRTVHGGCHEEKKFRSMAVHGISAQVSFKEAAQKFRPVTWLIRSWHKSWTEHHLAKKTVHWPH